VGSIPLHHFLQEREKVKEISQEATLSTLLLLGTVSPTAGRPCSRLQAQLLPLTAW
jgi:hypothetical protein